MSDEFLNRTCKGECTKYRAKRPPHGSRYASGQVRCQICEIFLTAEGVKDNRYCRCCNYRVRKKPRNKQYKEKYRRSAGAGAGQAASSPRPARAARDAKRERARPRRDPLDGSAKTYPELEAFLGSEEQQENHVLVMLKELAEYGRLHRGEIAESLAYFNNRNSSDIDVVRGFFDVQAYDLLVDRGFVTRVSEDPRGRTHYSLNVRLTEYERESVLEYLRGRIAEHNAARGIPDNEFPQADNMGSIDWESE